MPTSVLSSPRSPRRAQADASRAAILVAAARVFAAVGFAGARTDTIAAAAHVNKALLYYYFKSKEGLYVAVFEDQFRDFHLEAVGRLRAPGPAAQVLCDYINWHFDSIAHLQNRAALQQQFMAAESRLRTPLLRKYARPRSKALQELLRRGVASGEFRDIDVGHAAISITGLIIHYFSIGPILKVLRSGDAYSAPELARRKRSVLDLVRHGLFRHPGTSSS